MKSVKRMPYVAVICAILMVPLIMCSCRAETPVKDFEFEVDDGEIVITGYTGTDFNIVIPDKIEGRPVTVIGTNAFEGCDLKSVVFPDSLKRIEEQAFYDCNLLEDVKFPEGLEFIGYQSFGGCDRITEITLPDDVEFDMRVSQGLVYAYKIIWSPVGYDVTIYVSEGSQTLKRLQENEQMLWSHFNGGLASQSINYTVID